MSARMLLLTIVLSGGFAYAQEGAFPNGPGMMGVAESKGLPRVGVEELKQFMPGRIEAQDRQGTFRNKIFRADGKAEFKGGGHDNLVTWRIMTEKSGGYCTLVGMKRGEICFAVFRDTDGVHYYDYDLSDSKLYWVWRPVK